MVSPKAWRRVSVSIPAMMLRSILMMSGWSCLMWRIESKYEPAWSIASRTPRCRRGASAATRAAAPTSTPERANASDQCGGLLRGQSLGEFKDHSVRGQHGFPKQARQQGVQARGRGQFQRHVQVWREVLRGGEGGLQRREFELAPEPCFGGFREPVARVVAPVGDEPCERFDADTGAGGEIVDRLKSGQQHPAFQDRLDPRGALRRCRSSGLRLSGRPGGRGHHLRGAGGELRQGPEGNQVFLQRCFRVPGVGGKVFAKLIPDTALLRPGV